MADASPVQPQSTGDLMSQSSREYILLAGKDGVGKSCALVSLAKWIQDVLSPGATFFVLDTENKFPTALRSWGADAPTNISYYKCEDMNAVNCNFDHLMEKRKAGDWLAVESMARVWEKAQDLGYQATSGFTKAEYLEKRQALAAGGMKRRELPNVIPSPDRFWDVVKGAHDSEFMDQISQASKLNVILTTTTAKVKTGGTFPENATRRDARTELGLDVGLDGAPRLPTYVETAALLELQPKGAGSVVTCRILRDNLSSKKPARMTFEVEEKELFGQAFYINCR